MTSGEEAWCRAMAPAAVFALPFFPLYSAIGLFDTHLAAALAHCLFNIPLAVWRLEGVMSGVPKERDETAFIDGYGFWRFFINIFLPTIAAGIGVAAFFCSMCSWVELLLAKTLTSAAAKPIAATMTRQTMGWRRRCLRRRSASIQFRALTIGRSGSRMQAPSPSAGCHREVLPVATKCAAALFRASQVVDHLRRFCHYRGRHARRVRDSGAADARDVRR